MLLRLLWVSVAAASALAAPASGQRRGAGQAPNVVLVVSDSFVSTRKAGSGQQSLRDPGLHLYTALVKEEMKREAYFGAKSIETHACFFIMHISHGARRRPFL